MLSLECQTIYDILCELTGCDESYKIIEADEIMERLPSAVRLSKVQLSQLVKDLKDREYVRVKYFAQDEYCLMVLKHIDGVKAPVVTAETAKGGERQLYAEKKEKGVKVRAGAIFFMSLLGSILGSGIVATVAALVIKFVILK